MRTKKKRLRKLGERITLDNTGYYFDAGSWKLSWKPRWSDATVELRFYKGSVILSVDYASEQATAYQKATGYTISGSFWLRDRDPDFRAFEKMLAYARKFQRQHDRDVLKVVNCKRCYPNHGGTGGPCKVHASLYKHYEKATFPKSLVPRYPKEKK